MGFRFRKRIKIAPGVSLNFRRSGVSASIGPRGVTVNVSPERAPRATVGLPGTGVSYTQTLSSTTPPGNAIRGLLWIVVAVGVLAGAFYFLA